MTGPERVQRSTARFNPFGGIVFDHNSVPGLQKSGKKAENTKQPPRPQNAWILYRAWALSNLLDRQPELKGTPQSQISKILASKWANESPEVRKHFEHQANLSKERHAQLFPDYVFKPQKKEDKEKERERKKQERARAREEEKMRKEVEKSLRGAIFPTPMVAGPVPVPVPFIVRPIPPPPPRESSDSPSPPVSQCPSPPKEESTADDESDNEEEPDESDASTPDGKPRDAGASAYCTPVSNVSDFTSSVFTDGANQQTALASSSSTEALAPPINSTTFNSSTASSSSSSAPFDWSQFPSSSINDIDAFIRQAFPPGMLGPEPNRFEMPPGNLIASPGFVDGEAQMDNFDVSGLASIPLGNMPGTLDDQFDCDLTNPHAEQGSSSSSSDRNPQPGNEAIYMQPFVQTDVSLDQLLSAGKEIGNVLLDEQEACANGERVIAAEHVQNGAPAAPASRPSVASFLPSPPESSSSATSPLGSGLFDFNNATNLAASGSNKHIFGDLGFTDPMANSNMSSTAWSLPTFDTFAGHDNFGFGSSNDKSGSIAKLSTNTGDWRTGFQGGPFSSIPPTPISAGPWMGGGFDLGEMTMSDFSSATNAAPSSSNDVQVQRENAWLSSLFDDSGLGPV